MKHTKGPWHIGQGNGEGFIFPETGRMRMEMGGTTLYPICKITTGWSEEEDQANARRIVACVNACEGIPTAALECQAKKQITLKVIEDNEALLKALTGMLEVFCDHPETDEMACVQSAREAVLKARRGVRNEP